MACISFDPWHQKENARFGYSSDSELDNIISAAHAAWNQWRKTRVEEKTRLLKKLGDLLLKDKKDHARFITSEMGKVITQSVSEVEKCASLCYWYASNLEKLSYPETRKSSSGESTIYFESQGLILGVMPWNFPYWQAMRFIVPVISGGNGVILRHASCVPLCALSIEKLFLEAGFPENLCRSVFADHRQIEGMISDKLIRGVSLTGSTEAGRSVAEAAGRYLKKSVMELGGSDPFIVLDDADLSAAADAALFSRFQNCGQSCIAAKRIFVHSEAYEKFMELFIEKVNRLKIGDPYEEDTFIGPMINEEALIKLNSQVIDSVRMGSIILTGGERYLSDKPVYKPTVLTNVPINSPVICEEVFGPVIPVIVFNDIDDMIMLANMQPYGLGASVWSENHDVAQSVASQLDCGTVAVNGFVRSDPALPFGGVKDSGYGRELSLEGYREFLNIKTVTVFS